MDQLDLKRKMKPKLGEKVALRLKCTSEPTGGSLTAKGYELVQATDPEDMAIEMVYNGKTGPQRSLAL